MERLQAFGLIESNGEGGWQMTECCRAGLAGLEADTPASPKTGPVVIGRGRRAGQSQGSVRIDLHEGTQPSPTPIIARRQACPAASKPRGWHEFIMPNVALSAPPQGDIVS